MQRLFGAPRPASAAKEPLVPVGMQIAGAWSWRVLVIVGVAAVVFWLVAQLRLLVIPLMVAALLTALLVPLVDMLVRRRWPRGLAVTVAMLVLLGVVTLLGWLAVAQIRAGYGDLQQRAIESWQGFREWLVTSPLHVSEADLNEYLGLVTDAIQNDMQAVVSGALSVGTTLGHVVTGLLLALFATIFLLYDGRSIWRWLVGLFPKRARPAADGSGRAGWVTLGNFVRVQVLVAAIDATGIGLGALIIGLVGQWFDLGFEPMPLIIPISILVFLGSFIPVIGAIATGALAVLVALLTMGFWPAVAMLGVVLLVQQVEGHVLQPLIMGTAVKVHPLAVVLAVAGGSVIAGIAGALFAVPVVAFLNTAIKTVASGSWREHPRPTIEDIVREEHT